MNPQPAMFQKPNMREGIRNRIKEVINTKLDSDEAVGEINGIFSEYENKFPPSSIVNDDLRKLATDKCKVLTLFNQLAPKTWFGLGSSRTKKSKASKKSKTAKKAKKSRKQRQSQRNKRRSQRNRK